MGKGRKKGGKKEVKEKREREKEDKMTKGRKIDERMLGKKWEM